MQLTINYPPRSIYVHGFGWCLQTSLRTRLTPQTPMCSPLHRLMATWSKPRHDLGPEPERRSLRKAKQAAARRRLVLEGCFHRKGRSLYLGSRKAEQTLSTGFLSLVDCCLHTASFWFLMAGRHPAQGPGELSPSALLSIRKRWAPRSGSSLTLGRGGQARRYRQGTRQKGSLWESCPWCSLCAGLQKRKSNKRSFAKL